MTNIYGFELVREAQIPELNTVAQLYRHLKTGAELLSLQNEDENKVFNISFRTPPTDSTGVPHIMEHAVLGGSRKYRVKEPFVELIKGSLKTFVNAFTSPDKTSYPVASQNLQDFYNLIEVYLDAVFYPLLTTQHLEQEGWHLELEKPDAPLIYKGIVFNEMKGAYSSPDRMLYVHSKASLFPDTTYAFDSGGDPEQIPNLSYEQFKAFHRTYYHPSNARIIFYGDDPPQTRLELLDQYLRDFAATVVDSMVPIQPSFEQPRRFVFPVSVDAEADSRRKGMVQLNWLLPEGDDPELVMALSILSYALVSTPASPLRKALIDSGLGEDITGGGLSTQLRQMTFSVGLKGIDVANADQVEALILSTLQGLIDDGLDPAMIEAAVNTIEFSLRENNTGSFPRGLALVFRALSTWLYEGDPIATLAFERPLMAVKDQLAANQGCLLPLIGTYLLKNPHRTTVILQPDQELQTRQETVEKEKLARIRRQMSPDAVQTVLENSRQLKAVQEKPDAPEELAAIPMLTLADLDEEIKTIPIEVMEEQGGQILFHDLFTNGIVYFDLGFDLRLLPAELLPYAELFGRALLEMGTETESFVQLSQRIGAKTGGIHASTLTTAVRHQDEGRAYLFLRGKSTIDQAADLLDILRDILLTVHLDNPDRFRQIVLETKAHKEAMLVPSGHSVVNTRLRSRFDPSGWAAEQIGGVDSLFFVRRLADAIEYDWPTVLAALEKIRGALIGRIGTICNVTLDAANWHHLRPRLSAFLATLPAQAAQAAPWTATLSPIHEGLTIPSQVNYVAKGANLYQLGYHLDGSIAVITNIVRTRWLWEKIRAQGGAYGAFSMFSKNSGVLSFLSYRDPNLLGTLANFDGVAGFLHQLQLSDHELTSGIIGAIGALDAYQLPDAKGYTSMLHYLVGESDEARQRYRSELLATKIADFKALAEVLSEVNKQGLVVVMGSPEAITDADQRQGGWLKISKVL